jgi:hypothetical protein
MLRILNVVRGTGLKYDVLLVFHCAEGRIVEMQKKANILSMNIIGGVKGRKDEKLRSVIS